MVKLRVLFLTGLFIEFDCSRYQCSSEILFFNLETLEGQVSLYRSPDINNSSYECLHAEYIKFHRVLF